MRYIIRASLVCAAVALWTAACHDDNDEMARGLTGGSPARGRQAISKYGCQSCHSIPGIVAQETVVGPPLAGIATRTYIGGVVPNTPARMMAWIRNPQAIDDKSAMPNLGVSDHDARDIAAYLYTLR